jgi:2-oxoglutarate ferredoxin oxidoreductase subunit gamma
MNLPSLDKYEDMVKEGGILIVNQSMVDRPVKRTGIKIVSVPAGEIAEEIGNKKMANMVLMGALLANLDILPAAAIEKSLKEHLPQRHHHLLPHNLQAMQRGSEYAVETAH